MINNRKQFLLAHNIDFKNHICMKCNHGEEITTVNRSNLECGAVTQEDMILAEVLITQEKGLALMLLTGDCLPVSFYDPITETIALAHFSRQTITQLLPQKTIGFLREEFQVNPANLLIKIGPHIHAGSYSFPTPLQNVYGAIAPFILEGDGNAHIDLASAHNSQLTKEGVLLKNISVSGIDTATSSEHFSHYRSKKQNTLDGRLATILILR